MSVLKLIPKYFFGEKAIFEAKQDLLNQNYSKALILYGGGSTKRNGSFDDLVKLLNEINLPFVEFGGIEPNPKVSTVQKCVDFARSNKVDVVFAIGGGSVIDASKVIGVLINNLSYDDAWQYCIDVSRVSKGDSSKITNPSVDIVSIITLAGTASENNGGSVITNDLTNEKLGGVSNPTAIPKFVIEDPTYTYSVSKWQTASGIFDCFSHLLEQYLGTTTFEWTQNYLFANLKTLVEYAKIAVDDPTNYEARANILWTTSMALNGIATFNSNNDWAVHTIEHSFSGRWDVTHGAGLAFITPTYLKLRSQKELWFRQKLEVLGKEVFNANCVHKTIEAIVKFIKSIYLPVKWTDFSEIKEINSDDVKFLADHSVQFNFAPHIDRTFYQQVINELVKLN